LRSRKTRGSIEVGKRELRPWGGVRVRVIVEEMVARARIGRVTATDSLGMRRGRRAAGDGRERRALATTFDDAGGGGDAGADTTDTPGVTAVSETIDSTGAEVRGSKDLAEVVGAGSTMEA